MNNLELLQSLDHAVDRINILVKEIDAKDREIDRLRARVKELEEEVEFLDSKGALFTG